HGWIVGRYVIMPDHVHFFCSPETSSKSLSDFVGCWKGWTSRRAGKVLRPRSATSATRSPRFWQSAFFDHVLRSNESYDQEWNYVFDNPVRAGLVSSATDWKYAGEIETLTL